MSKFGALVPFDPSAVSWRTSAACHANNGCIEVARLSDGTAGIRDSTRGDAGPALTFSLAEFRSFIAEVRGGGLDLPA